MPPKKVTPKITTMGKTATPTTTTKAATAAKIAAATKPTKTTTPASTPNTTTTTAQPTQQQQQQNVKKFGEATAVLKHLLRPPNATSAPQNLHKSKPFVDAIRVAHNSLSTTSPDKHPAVISKEQCLVYTDLLHWFLTRCCPRVNEIDGDLLVQVLAILINVNSITIYLTDEEKKKAATSTTATHAADTVAQSIIFGNTFLLNTTMNAANKYTPLYINKTTPTSLTTALIDAITAKITAFSAIKPSALTQSAYNTFCYTVLNFLTFVYQIVGYATFVKNATAVDENNKHKDSVLMIQDAEILSLIITLERVFAYFTDGGDVAWGKVKGNPLAVNIMYTTIHIISAIMTYDAKVEIDRTTTAEGGGEQQQDEDNGVDNTNQISAKPEDDVTLKRLHQSPEAIKALCTIIFGTIASLILHQINAAQHPLVLPQGLAKAVIYDFNGHNAANKNERTPTPPEEKIHVQVLRQVFNQAHFLTVGYVAYYRQQQADGDQPNPYTEFINKDFIVLLITYLRFLDTTKQLSIENDEQQCIQRITLVMASSGLREAIAVLMQAGYFEFLISLVYDIDAKKLQPSAVLLRADTIVKDEQQKEQFENMYNKQLQVEVSRIAFFCLQLDCFVHFGALGYSSRHLLLTNYNILGVIEALLTEKLIKIDNITRRQSIIVEKLALFVKNFVSQINYYHEFDYLMYCNMLNNNKFGLKFDFNVLKQQTFEQLYITNQTAPKYPTIEELEKDEEELTVFQTRLSDDIYHVYLYELYYTYNFSLIWPVLLPCFCLYYKYQQVDDNLTEEEQAAKANATTTTTTQTTTTTTTNNVDDEKKAINTALKATQLIYNKKGQVDPKFSKDIQDIFNQAVIQGAIHQQMTNFNIVADLIHFIHFLPSYHLFSYTPQHFAASQSLTNNTDPTKYRTLSPLQIAVLTLFYKTKHVNTPTEDVTPELLIKSCEDIVKDNTKDLITGVFDKNDSNDDPALGVYRKVGQNLNAKHAEEKKVVDALTLDAQKHDYYQTRPKLDAIVSQVVQYTYSLLANNEKAQKKTAEGADAEESMFLKFDHIRDYESVEQFLTTILPQYQFY